MQALLIFDDYKLEHLATSINVSIALSTLRILRLHQCDNTDAIFPTLTPNIHLHTLEIENYTSTHPLSLTNLLPFLSSFSTLRSFICSLPDPTSTWTTTPVIDALKSHEALETCILSIGTHAATLPDLRALRSNHPHLRTLGFRINPNTKTPRTTKHWTHSLAVEVVQFRELEKWLIMASMQRDVGVMGSCKAMRLADAMRKTCCGLAGGEGCRVRAIGILARSDWYSREEIEAGEVPRVREYFYPALDG